MESFIAKSGPLDLSGIEWEKAAAQPVSAVERRILPYFIDVEAYTIAYLRALLNTSGIKDPEIADFLGIWVYEESFHGRALEKFLAAAGFPLAPDRPKSVQKPRRLLEAMQDFGATIVSNVFDPDFVAVHMTWGAIQELTTLNGYRRLVARTRNDVLAEIIRRIMREESRHFNFYFHKAEERLSRSPKAQKLTAFLVKRFWKPVGAGIMPDGDLDFLTAYTFAGPEGMAEVAHIDRTIARLPGMEWFDGMARFVDGAQRRTGASVPPLEHPVPSLG